MNRCDECADKLHNRPDMKETYENHRKKKKKKFYQAPELFDQMASQPKT